MEAQVFSREGCVLHARYPQRAAACCLGFPLLAVVALIAAGCAPPPGPKPTPSPTAAAVVGTPLAVRATAAFATPTIAGPTLPLTLALWLPPDMAISAQSPGQAIYQMNAAFGATNPHVWIETVPKDAYGFGGMANMLLTTQAVVPARMPDIAVLDVAEVYKLVGEDILRPLDDLFPQGLWDDLFPFALASVTVNGKRMAMPFQADISFLVYNDESVQNPPRTWDELLRAKSRYVFPAADGDGSAADTFVLQYLAQGGDLSQRTDRPFLDTTIAAQVLRQYRAAVESGAVPDRVRNLRTLDDCWAAFLTGEADMANTSSWHYQRDRATLQHTHYAQIPTAGGETLTLAHSWAWVIITKDPRRQEVAIRYIVSALRPESLSAWSAASSHLPVHRSVLSRTIGDEAYGSFLADQLQHARSYPSLRGYSEVQAALVRAIEDVLDGVTTPERAAVSAAAMVARLR